MHLVGKLLQSIYSFTTQFENVLKNFREMRKASAVDKGFNNLSYSQWTELQTHGKISEAFRTERLCTYS